MSTYGSWATHAMVEYSAAGVNPLGDLNPLQIQCLWEGIALTARNEASEYRAVAAKIRTHQKDPA